MNMQIAPCGGFYYDTDTMEVIQQDGKDIFTIIGGGGEGGSITRHNNDPEAHELIQLDCGDLG